MKKFYDKHFRVDKNEKIKEHVMMMRLWMSIVVICISLCSLSLTAYAFFTYTVTSSSNTIKAASFSLTKTVAKADDENATVSKKDGVYTLAGDTDKPITYQVKMKGNKVTASSGFVKIRVTYDGTEAQDHYTAPILKGDIKDGEYVIFIKVPAGRTAAVKFTDNWGTCSSDETVANGATLTSKYVDLSDPPTQTTIEEDDEKEAEGEDEGEADDETDDSAEPDSDTDTGENPDANVGSGDDSDNPSVDDSKKEESQDGDKEPEDGDDSDGAEPEVTPDETPVEEVSE